MIKTISQIYIVDDDESVRIALSRLLKSAGFEAEAFNSADRFLDSVPADAKGILILDVRMPDIDGFQLQEKLNAVGSRLQIIFITAHAESGEKKRAMEAGAKGFLQKPFNDELLLELIRSLQHED